MYGSKKCSTRPDRDMQLFGKFTFRFEQPKKRYSSSLCLTIRPPTAPPLPAAPAAASIPLPFPVLSQSNEDGERDVERHRKATLPRHQTFRFPAATHIYIHCSVSPLRSVVYDEGGRLPGRPPGSGPARIFFSCPLLSARFCPIISSVSSRRLPPADFGLHCSKRFPYLALCFVLQRPRIDDC